MGGALRVALLAGAGLLAAFPAATARAADAACPSVWPPRAPTSSAGSLDANDLLMVRDIGIPEPAQSAPSPLAVSPDGRLAAFFVTQASLAANDYCETLVVVDLTGKQRARVLDHGGERILAEEALRGVRRQSGVPDVNRPAWSPDGSSLAYRKRVGGRTQVWRVDLAGAGPRQVTHSEQDVEGVGWSSDGQMLLYAIRPGRAGFDAAKRDERTQGYLYDARVLPQAGPEPQLPEELPQAVMAVPALGGSAWPANPAQAASYTPLGPIGAAELGPGVDRRGWRAGADPVGGDYFASRRLWVETPSGARIACMAPACTGSLAGVVWSGTQVLFLRREGWNEEISAIYAWSPGRRTARPLLRTSTWLLGCAGTAEGAVCLAESARRARHLVAIARQGGQPRALFDPNPELARKVLPDVVRLRWRNRLGLEAWGDLVLPEGPPPAGGWPLVVVQYRSRGFLRGGVGDEYPIFPMVARGIAVLSFERPQFVASLGKVADVDALVAATYKDWAERRSVHDSLMEGLALVLARGAIDRRRMGISGLSDGSTTVRYALINAPAEFAAAAISTCCIEPKAVMTDGGLAQAEWFRRLGFPPASRDAPQFWRPVSIALNAGEIRTPLLMQLADDEYQQALEAFTALRENARPVEMHVFADEHHNKWQPRHRAAIYARSLDWFAFWLQGKEDADPAKAAQYRRWRAMREAARGARPSSP